MLSVLLKIFAVLGIILLVVLGIIIFALMIVLFVPITYRITAQIDKEHKEAAAKVNWLFGIVRLRLNYTDSLTWKMYILWFDLTGNISKKKVQTEKQVPDTKEQTEKQVPEENAQTAKNDDSQASVLERVKEIWAMITHYIEVLKEEDTKDLISHFFGVVGTILKRIRPRKLEADVIFGFDSPDITGKIYGLLCMLYPYYGNDIHITPDFENTVIVGKVFSRGRVHIYVLLWNALRLLVNKKLFKVIHKFKNGGKGKNGR